MYRQMGVEKSKYGVTGDLCLQVVKGSRDLLLEFWDPSISRERFKPETSNLARRMITRVSYERNKNWVKGILKGHVTYF